MSNPSPSLIVGAGLAGLLAAHAWPLARIAERSPEPRPAHRAVLRFRSDAVSRLTGIPFRRVTVRKGIWFEGAFRRPDIRLANMYSRKCLGRIAPERSVWNLDAAERFVAPEDFYGLLLANVGPRIDWGRELVAVSSSVPVVSTAPLSETIGYLSKPPALDFARAPISVLRFLLPDTVDVHQTIYFPDARGSLYRASITGRVLICEFAGERLSSADRENGKGAALEAFGLADFGHIIVSGEPARQHFGKIATIADDAARKHALFRLTHECGVYSLGRFATWRNILLDDVVNDIDVIKRLLRSASPYDLRNES